MTPDRIKQVLLIESLSGCRLDFGFLLKLAPRMRPSAFGAGSQLVIVWSASRPVAWRFGE
jgi:hypothetical protein